MNREDKELLLKDLCARLPYGVMCKASIPDIKTDTPPEEVELRLTSGMLTYIWIDCRELRPYLRPMHSMTSDEREERFHIVTSVYDDEVIDDDFVNVVQYMDWLHEHHFDYRDLISKGLALEAPSDMYK